MNEKPVYMAGQGEIKFIYGGYHILKVHLPGVGILWISFLKIY